MGEGPPGVGVDVRPVATRRPRRSNSCACRGRGSGSRTRPWVASRSRSASPRAAGSPSAGTSPKSVQGLCLRTYSPCGQPVNPAPGKVLGVTDEAVAGGGELAAEFGTSNASGPGRRRHPGYLRRTAPGSWAGSGGSRRACRSATRPTRPATRNRSVRRTSPWSLFSSITITTWAGRDAAPAGVAGAISPDVDEGTVVASEGGSDPRAQEGAAPTAPTIRNAARARTGRRVTDPILPAAQPGGPGR